MQQANCNEVDFVPEKARACDVLYLDAAQHRASPKVMGGCVRVEHINGDGFARPPAQRDGDQHESGRQQAGFRYERGQRAPGHGCLQVLSCLAWSEVLTKDIYGYFYLGYR